MTRRLTDLRPKTRSGSCSLLAVARPQHPVAWISFHSGNITLSFLDWARHAGLAGGVGLAISSPAGNSSRECSIICDDCARCLVTVLRVQQQKLLQTKTVFQVSVLRISSGKTEEQSRKIQQTPKIKPQSNSTTTVIFRHEIMFLKQTQMRTACL